MKQVNLVIFVVALLILSTGSHVRADGWTLDSGITVGSTFTYEIYSESGCPPAYNTCTGYIQHLFEGESHPLGLMEGTTTTATVLSISNTNIDFNWFISMPDELDYRNSTGALITLTNQTTDTISMDRSDISFFDAKDLYYPLVTNDVASIESTFTSNSDIDITKTSTTFTATGDHTVHSKDSGKESISYTNTYTLAGLLISSSYTLHYSKGTSAPYDPYAFNFGLQLIETSVTIDPTFICSAQSCEDPVSSSATSVESSSSEGSEDSPLSLSWALIGIIPLITIKRKLRN